MSLEGRESPVRNLWLTVMPVKIAVMIRVNISSGFAELPLELITGWL